MTAVWIVGGILLFFGVLLSFSITIYIKITEEISIEAGAFGYKVKIDLDGEKKKEKSPKKSKVEAAKKKVTDKKTSQKSLSETLDFSITLIKSILPNSIEMLKHIRITSLRLYMTVACEMADETALAYGEVSAGVYTLLGVLDNTFKLKIKSVDIIPDFVTGEAEYNISFKVKLRFIHVILASIGIIFKIIVNTIKRKEE